jgi:hypothetical protein
MLAVGAILGSPVVGLAAANRPVLASVSPSAVSWSTTRAERRVQESPPPTWRARGWDIASVICDGLGPGRQVPGGRVYQNFSCEILVVSSLPCNGRAGPYVCAARFESTAQERTLHVLDATRYALYRVRQ